MTGEKFPSFRGRFKDVLIGTASDRYAGRMPPGEMAARLDTFFRDLPGGSAPLIASQLAERLSGEGLG
jgi:hypothetical protein